jgi:hypothetical protein
MDLKDIDDALKRTDQSADQERKRILEEMRDAAAALAGKKRGQSPEPEVNAVTETEGDFGFGTSHVPPEDRHRFQSGSPDHHLFVALLGEDRDPAKLTPSEQTAFKALEAYAVRLLAWMRDNRLAFDRATNEWEGTEARITPPSVPKRELKAEMPKGTDLRYRQGFLAGGEREVIRDPSGNLPVPGPAPDEERANLKVLAKALHKRALPIAQALKKCRSEAERERVRAGIDPEDAWILRRPELEKLNIDTPWSITNDVVAAELSQRAGKKITEGMVRGYLQED